MKTQGGLSKTVVKLGGAAILLCGSLLLIILGNGTTRKLPNASANTRKVAQPQPFSHRDSRWLEAYGKLPLSFEQNLGQTSHEVRYVAHGGNYELFLTPQEAVVALQSRGLDFSPRHRFDTLRALREARRNSRPLTQTAVLRLQLEGSNPQARITGTDQLPGRVNYFVGNDPGKWHTEIPTYAKVKYSGIYPGVDLVFYGSDRRLEYDFIVAPGAEPSAIALKVDGARRMRLNAKGDVVISVTGGEVQLQKPVVYQSVNGVRHEIPGNYEIAGNRRLTFSVPHYDRNEPLVLDPVLNYSTYVGGTGNDYATGLALDTNGDAYIAGVSFSTDFPTTSNGFIQAPLTANTGTSVAAFVAELNPAGTTLLYSSYIAGSTPGETAFAIAVNPTGDAVYVTGQTLSPDFPTNSTIAGFKTGTNAGATAGTSYLVKFDPTQSGAASFVYSTFIGGTNASSPNGDLGQGVAADASGNAYVTGLTDCSPGTATDLTTFPIVGGFQTTLGNSNGGGNAFLTKINTTVAGASSLVSSSYLGGNATLFTGANSPGFGDAGFGVAIDSSGNAYIIGTTTSTNLATLTTTGLNLTYPAGNTSNTAFFAEINTATATAQSLSYLTYLGGNAADFGDAIALGPNSVAYLTGNTTSLNFPVSTGAYQTTGNSVGVAFVGLIDTTQSPATSLTHSTFLGGGGGDDGFAIRADSQGNAYVGGGTSSVHFPVTQGALQTTFPSGAFGNGFVSKFDPTLSTLLYSSYFGGSGDGNSQDIDAVNGLAIDSSTPPNVFIAGKTHSTNLPVVGTPVAPLHAGLNGTAGDAFVASLQMISTLVVTPSPFNFGIQQLNVKSAPQAFLVTNNTASAVTFNSVSITGVSPASNTDFAISSDGCTPSVAAGAPPCTINVTFTPSVAAVESATLTITAVVMNGGQSSTQTFTVNLTGTGSNTAPGVMFTPTSVSFGNQAVSTTSSPTPVTLTNNGLGPLTINSIAASGDFAETSTGASACPIGPATLAAGASCTINVTFTPTAAGARTGTLSVADNASGSPHTVPLSGTGTGGAAMVVLSPTSAALGNQIVTTTSAATPIKLTNTGAGPLTINAVAASGDFAETSTGAGACPIGPATLAAGASCTINVTFTPTATGSRSGTLTVTDNATGSPHTVSLSGTGWDFQVTAPSTVTGNNPFTFNATMTPLGGFNQSVAFTCSAGSGLSCSIVTPIAAADGVTPQSVPVGVSKKATALFPKLPVTPEGPPLIAIFSIVAAVMILLLLMMLPSATGGRVRFGLLAAAIFLVVLAGCSNSAGTPFSGTLTITGTSTGTAGSVSHSTTVTVDIR